MPEKKKIVNARELFKNQKLLRMALNPLTVLCLPFDFFSFKIILFQIWMKIERPNY